MIGALFRKELGEQRPFLWLGVAMGLFELIEVGRSDTATTFEEFRHYAYPMLYLFLAFALTSGLIAREREDGTLAFLEALPVSRWEIFLSKAATSAFVGSVYPCFVAFRVLANHALTKTSLSVEPPWTAVFLVWALSIAVVLIASALGMLFAHTGKLNWMLLAMVAFTLIAIEPHATWVHEVNPLGLTAIEHDGARWQVPWSALSNQAVIALGCAALAFGLYALSGWNPPTLSPRVKGVWATLASAVAGLLLIGMVGLEASREEGGVGSFLPDERRAEQAVPVHATEQHETQHYRFTFPGNRREQARALLDAADETYAAVFALLPAEGSSTIAAALGSSANHTAGTARWESLRMQLGGADDLGTLAHETAHVLAMRAAGRDAQPLLEKMIVLNEGLATWAEHQVLPNRDEQDWDHFFAAALRHRDEVRWDEVMDADLMRLQRDWSAAYPLGRLLVETLVESGGDDAPLRVMQALASVKPTLKGLDLWQQVFDRADLSLTEVMDAWFERLDEEAARYLDQLEALPRPRAALVPETEGWVGVQPMIDEPLPQGWALVCRFRRTETTSHFEYTHAYVANEESNGVCWQELSELPGKKLHYQLGLRAPGGRILYERWETLPVR